MNVATSVAAVPLTSRGHHSDSDDDLGLLFSRTSLWRKPKSFGLLRVGVIPLADEPGATRCHRASHYRLEGMLRPALDVGERRVQGRPYEPSISTDEFLDATLDLWHIRPSPLAVSTILHRFPSTTAAADRAVHI